jgi:hypothetical protein
MVFIWALPNVPVSPQNGAPWVSLSTLPNVPVSLQYGMPWVSLSVGLNIIVTSMICFRILRMRALLRQVNCPATLSKMYTNVAAMLIESAAPFTILGIGLLVTMVNDGPLIYGFGYVWTMFCVC